MSAYHSFNFLPPKKHTPRRSRRFRRKVDFELKMSRSADGVHRSGPASSGRVTRIQETPHGPCKGWLEAIIENDPVGFTKIFAPDRATLTERLATIGIAY